MLEIKSPRKTEKTVVTYIGAEGEPFADWTDAHESLIIEAFCAWYTSHSNAHAIGSSDNKRPTPREVVVWLLSNRDTVEQLYAAAFGGNCGVSTEP